MKIKKQKKEKETTRVSLPIKKVRLPENQTVSPPTPS